MSVQDPPRATLAPGQTGMTRKAMTGVLNVLIENVVSGVWPQGSLLPAEETLLDHFGVSRPTLRESLQHMVAAGLVRSRPRAGTVVQPQAQWNLLDPVVLEAALRHMRDRSFYDNLVDARMLIEPEAAALAARNAAPRALAAIGAAFADMVESEGRDTESWSMADLAFHTAIIEASENWVLRQFIVAIRAALMASFRMTNRASQSHEGAIAMHRAVYDAIQRGQPEEARQAMQALIGLARQDMNRSFG
ncbi:MAG: GntR family transcriptional regulator [Rhodobacteraceae bacterium GWE1_64_9]|nr:MAG: GntR family transcriptional regulator [Rhodobacteraceae bacterium GWE1_64_9]OHC48336.1 MAG: GntR family transcriptional regulator [Rhodobacteraceae bacterium GWF1_65_7]HBU16088.1 GntR family transcriptional regulator [Gemmobacter sp.]